MHLSQPLRAAAATILIAAPWQAAAEEAGQAARFFMFAAARFADRSQDEAVRAVLRQYLDGRDYVGVELRNRDPELARRIPRDHVFALPASVATVQKRAQAGDVRLLIYDIEHWPATPQQEQHDPASAVDQALAAGRAGGCRMGIAPDGQLLGIDLATQKASAENSLLRRIDVRKADLVGLQTQRLLSDDWAAGGGLEHYVSFVTELARDIKQRSPQTLVVAQVSFRYTPVERMIEALHRVQPVVDGFYLAFPAVTPNVPCHYCDAANLRKLLAALRTPPRN